MTKADAIASYCESLRSNGVSSVGATQFEQGLRQFIIDNGYSVRGFGKDTESNGLSGSINYTMGLIDNGKIPNVARAGSIYQLYPSNRGANPFDSYNNNSSARNRTTTQRQPSNTQYRQPSNTQYRQPTNTQYQPTQGQSDASSLTGCVVFVVLIGGLYLLTKILPSNIPSPLDVLGGIFHGIAGIFSSTKVWALLIALLTTRFVLFSKSQDFNLLGRIFITAVVWLSAFYFL